MASMDLDTIIRDLNKRFAAPLPEFYRRRIIFWHDEDREFEDKLDDIRVEGSSVRIGYGRDADIRIDRDTVSNLHARIDREGDTYYIEDLNSTNGTFVNDEPLAYKERRKLESNDSVRFAEIRYRFV